MPKFYPEEIKNFENILDFLRFGMTKANEADIYYGHGTDNVLDEMRTLLFESLKLPFESDPIFLSARLTENEKNFLLAALNRRINERVPVPYITHNAYFCGLSFYVDERVLIPRSPIAELIENRFAPWVESHQVFSILDLCTGSGCIAIACCHYFPEARVDAVDLSTEALEVAKINSEKHAVSDQLSLLQSDCFQNIPKTEYDIIVSNPPYVSMEEIQTLPAEYHHEPTMALRADNKGLAIVERILKKAADYLSPKGILVVEVGNSEEALLNAFPQVPFTWLEFEKGGTGVFLLTKNELQQHFNRKK